MEQEERRIWLIRQLQKEMPDYAGIPLPEDPERQWQLFRGLCNLLPPRKASREFLEVQDAFLQEMTREKASLPWMIWNPLRWIPGCSCGREISPGSRPMPS